jgi:hypothetical protein
MAVLWVLAPCSLVEDYWRFGDSCCNHHQGRVRNWFEVRRQLDKVPGSGWGSHWCRRQTSASKTSVNFCQTTRRNNAEGSHLHTRPRENRKPHLDIFLRVAKITRLFRSCLCFRHQIKPRVQISPYCLFVLVCFVYMFGPHRFPFLLRGKFL